MRKKYIAITFAIITGFFILGNYIPVYHNVKILRLTKEGRELCEPRLFIDKCRPFSPRPSSHFRMSGKHFKRCWLLIGPDEYLYNEQCNKS